MVVRGHHTGFTVANLERTVKFYTEGLGLEISNTIKGPQEYHQDITGYPGTHLEVAFVAVPDSPPLEFIQYVKPAGDPLDMETYRPGNGHIALVVDDVVATAERLKKLGGVPRTAAPASVPSGPNKGAKLLYLRDPDGITIELVEFATA